MSSLSIRCTACGSMNSATADTCAVCGAAPPEQSTSLSARQIAAGSRTPRPAAWLRVVAAVWFSVAFLIPAFLYFVHEESAFFPVWSAEFVLVVLVPAVLTGLFGAAFRAGILISSDHYAGWLAILRGLGIACISYLLFVALAAAYRWSGGYDRGFLQFAWLLLYIFLISSPVVLPSMMIIGALSGWLLHCIRKMFVRLTPRPKLSELE